MVPVSPSVARENEKLFLFPCGNVPFCIVMDKFAFVYAFSGSLRVEFAVIKYGFMTALWRSPQTKHSMSPVFSSSSFVTCSFLCIRPVSAAGLIKGWNEAKTGSGFAGRTGSLPKPVPAHYQQCQPEQEQRHNDRHDLQPGESFSTGPLCSSALNPESAHRSR